MSFEFPDSLKFNFKIIKYYNILNKFWWIHTYYKNCISQIFILTKSVFLYKIQ